MTRRETAAGPLHKRGDYMPGDFEGPHYVRGHVPFDEAFATVCAENGNDPDEWNFTARHVYGRCGQDSATAAGYWDYSLYEYDTHGAGRFPITRIDYGDHK